MALQALGLVLSASLYVVGAALHRQAVVWRIGSLPLEWREHPELRDGYDAFLTGGVRTLWSQPLRSWWLGLGAAGIVFALLALADFSTAFELTYIACFAALWLGGLIERGRRRVRDTAQRLSLRMPPQNTHSLSRQILHWSPMYLVLVGYLGTAVFLGGIVARAVS